MGGGPPSNRGGGGPPSNSGPGGPGGLPGGPPAHGGGAWAITGRVKKLISVATKLVVTRIGTIKTCFRNSETFIGLPLNNLGAH
jgi:hypothetical protein